METCEVCSRPAVGVFTTKDGVIHFFCEPLVIKSNGTQCFTMWLTERIVPILRAEKI